MEDARIITDWNNYFEPSNIDPLQVEYWVNGLGVSVGVVVSPHETSIQEEVSH